MYNYSLNNALVVSNLFEDFDFYIVKLELIIEISGNSRSVGRCGKKIANAFSKYDQAEEFGHKIERFEPCQFESGYAIN